ncbi:class I SAM-dependent methyltransferase [Domibacillus indicus]|uniref:class I SAM-dependent methyltransferase n=1 Tax=Domibacillus indicus TaxID=1437523 RepID=UPI000695C29E|nr:class I SAM-dependent methyltransferase [Domibacillus indicus]
MKKSYLDFLAEFGIGGAHPGGFSLTKEIFSSIDLPEGAKVLEVGCGTGQSAEYLATVFHCTVTAIDSHPTMLEKAAERLSPLNVEVKYGEAEQLEFPDGTFDFILAESVIAFTSPLQQTIAEMARVLKKEGTLLVIEMTAEKPLSGEQEQEVKDLYGVTEVLTEDEWITSFQRAGFRSCRLLDNMVFEEALTELRLSENISEELYDIWDAHEAFMSRPDTPLSYRVFYCRK